MVVNIAGYTWWEWLVIFQNELLLFAAIFFLIGAIDDIVVDLSWIWLKISGKSPVETIDDAEVVGAPLAGDVAVFVPAWNESEVITTHLRMPWLHGPKTTFVSTLDVIATTPRPLKPQCARLLVMPVCVWWCTGGPAPTYGASQAGAVLNFRLAPDSSRDPRAYARIYRALIDQGETEIAAGISARPLAGIPLRAHTELRVTEFQTSTEVRPAAFVTTELPVLHLPLGIRAEGYGQAGYVGGKEATAFADGQVHLMRDLKRFDLGAFSIGAGAWAGAQEGAERLDVGPSMRVDLTIAQAPARFSLDYRERVAGDAEPQSGVAVTLSTHF